MGQMLSWTNIKKSFPNEWVAIANPEGDLSTSYGEINGELLVHNADEIVFTELLKNHNFQGATVDIRYTGNILPDDPVGPILWQTSGMNS